MLLQIQEPGIQEKSLEESLAIGIDLGTTNSAIAIAHNNTAQLILVDGKPLVPSVVSYKNKKAIVGQGAFDKKLKPYVISSVKRLMEPSPFLPVNNNISQTPIEVSADILKYLRQAAEDHLGKPIQQAVITVPAYFSERARSATREAAHLAGLKVLRLLNEPTAAALAYQLDEGPEGFYVIYDLGGGTFDISLLKLEKGIFQVLAVGGDTALGGDDVDQSIVDYLAHKYQGFSISSALARQLKEYLSNHPEQHEISLQENGNIILTQEEFCDLLKPLMDKTLKILDQTLKDADVKISDIQNLVCVGGMTCIPFVRKGIKKHTEKQPLFHHNASEIVALGAALQAEALLQGTGKLLIDVNPLSLGIETMGRIVEKLIPRNTPVPFSVQQEFTTFQDNQKSMSIHVLQGEGQHVSDCRSLAKFTLQNLPPMPANECRVQVSFGLDADGILTVSATEKTTGIHQAVEIKPSYELTHEQVRSLIL